MRLDESKMALKKAIQNVRNSNEFEFAFIDFVLVKKDKNKTRMVIGVYESKNHYIVLPNGKVIEEHDIIYNGELKGLLPECINGFILCQLNNGYDCAYMEISQHVSMWKFIGKHLLEAENILKGIHSYFHFCQETGVNIKLLEYHSFSEIYDAYKHFMIEMHDEYEVLLSEILENDYLVMSGLCTDDGYIFRVAVIEMQKNKVKYENFYYSIDSAINDYRKQFVGMHYDYFLRKENEDNMVISYLKDVHFEDED